MVSNAEFFRTTFRLPGKQRAHVDASASDAVIACPSAQHFPRTAAKIKHAGTRLQA